MSIVPAPELTRRADAPTGTAEAPLHGPAAEFIPRYPASWYLFASSSEVRDRPVARQMLGRLLVAYRGESGQVAVVDGRCAHMGAELSKGSVVGERLRCPFHGWEFGPGGGCEHIPRSAQIPAFARIGAFPTVERHGLIFFFNRAAPLFPLPFFRDTDPEHFIAAAPFEFEYDAPWYVVVANAFDMQHFHVVHDRKLIGQPIIDCPHPFARRIQYRVEVVGDSAADRLIRAFIGDTAEVEQTLWQGNILVTHARFTRAQSYMMFLVQPRESGGTRLIAIALLRRPGSGRPSPLRRPAERISIAVRRWLTRQFMAHENELLPSLRYSPQTFIEADRVMVEYFHWLTTLPQA